jgi:hypothetical protein
MVRRRALSAASRRVLVLRLRMLLLEQLLL